MILLASSPAADKSEWSKNVSFCLVWFVEFARRIICFPVGSLLTVSWKIHMYFFFPCLNFIMISFVEDSFDLRR